MEQAEVVLPHELALFAGRRTSLLSGTSGNAASLIGAILPPPKGDMMVP